MGSRRVAAWAVLAGAFLMDVGAAGARDFKVYGYETPRQGGVELTYWYDNFFNSSNNNYPFVGGPVSKEGLQRHSFEVEYGVTDRWTIAGYADLEDPRGADLEYVQTRAVVSRYRFFDPGDRFFDTALYFEYYLPRANYRDNEQIEARLILERPIGPVTLRINPMLEKNISGANIGEGVEVEYATGLYLPSFGPFKPGLEFYGEMGTLSDLPPWKDQEHLVFPVLDIRMGDLTLHTGLGFGLTQAADDGVFTARLEYEFE